MENASKALIIAGAILISIVLIAIGVLVVSSMQGTVDESIANMSQQEKQIFNAKFEGYASEKQSPGNVKALIGAVIASNDSNIVDEESEEKGPKQVGVVLNGGDEQFLSKELSTVRSSVKQGTTYKVELEYGKGGLVTLITISDTNQ